MKTALKTVLTLKVHYLLFVLACASLVAVCLSAKSIADDISSMADKAAQETTMPMPNMAGG